MSYSMIDPKLRSVQRKIVTIHNRLRTKVQPPASDMLAMTWHKEAAQDAQRWASKCRLLTHDSITGRWVEDYGSCGQNIFVSTHLVPWHFAIQTWDFEKHNFTYGSSKNNLFEVGHYTQLVWAATHKVGCGFARCPLKKKAKWRKNMPAFYYNYVCNYCPIGNYVERLGFPYKSGQSCGRCQSSCKANKLCTNSCQYADLWVNCRELNMKWNNWLCHTTNTPEGRERYRHCRATCSCQSKIYTRITSIKRRYSYRRRLNNSVRYRHGKRSARSRKRNVTHNGLI
ncbi:serotriflin-like isoform X2 [Artemia franciscana]